MATDASGRVLLYRAIGPAEQDALFRRGNFDVGAGPNLGLAVARRFGTDGFAVGLVSRTESRLVELAGQLRLDGITTAGAAGDIRDSDALAGAIRSLADELGPVEVLEY